mmetsp:Transcript_12265/g.16747  ORF Transcript_12265/g.16747 Transcript_12265/m.16747 type:complete len:108 (+) Transcript_12265:1668-1991(+)
MRGEEGEFAAVVRPLRAIDLLELLENLHWQLEIDSADFANLSMILYVIYYWELQHLYCYRPCFLRGFQELQFVVEQQRFSLHLIQSSFSNFWLPFFTLKFFNLTNSR